MSKSIPGSIYLNGKRYWWGVKLPGESQFRARPLKPAGSKFATKILSVAENIAKEIYAKAIAKEKNAGKFSGCDGTIRAIYERYLGHAKRYYLRADGQQAREIENIERALEPLTARYGAELAEDFGPGKLKELRQSMIDSGELCRNTINQRIGIVRRMFRWAVSEELMSSHVIHALEAVDGLKFGRSGAKERQAIKPIAVGHVLATLPYATPVVRDMILVQLYTGMRPGELVSMRPCDIDTTGEIWLYRPVWHKTKHFGHEREIAIGPRAQELLKPYL